MKLIALVFALALFAQLSFAQYTTVKSRDYRRGHIKNLLEDGLDFVIDTQIEDGALSNTDFDLDSITKVEKKSVDDGTKYKFTVVISDGDVKAKAIYRVLDTKSGKDQVTSSSIYFIDRSKQGEDGAPAGQNAWSRVSLSKYRKSETMKEALADGIDYIIKQGIAHEILPNATFRVSEPNYVASVKVGSGTTTKYRFQVALKNEYGTAETTFVVKKGKVVSYILDHTDIEVPEPEAPEAPEVPETAAPEAPEAPEAAAPAAPQAP